MAQMARPAGLSAAAPPAGEARIVARETRRNLRSTGRAVAVRLIMPLLLCGMTAAQALAQLAYPPANYSAANNTPAANSAPANGAAAGGPRGRPSNVATWQDTSLRIAQQPAAPGGQPLPAPGGLPEDVRPAQMPAAGTPAFPGTRGSDDLDGDSGGLGAEDARLPLMIGDAPAGIGRTPQPTPEQRAEYGRFFKGIIDSEATLDLVKGFPRLLVFKEPPLRVQIADPAVADYVLITDREISVKGEKVDATQLNFWFADPQNPQQPKVLSYRVRVWPDPEGIRRQDERYKRVEAEINRNFPNSWVRLSMVGERLLLQGEAKDIVEAAQILQVVMAVAPGARGQRGGNQSVAISSPANAAAGQGNSFMMGTPQEFVNAQQAAAGNTVTNQLLSGSSSVINQLRVPGEQQVMLRVTVAEVNRNAARAIGVNFNGFPSTANSMTSVSGGSASTSNAFPYIFQQLAGGVGTGNLPVLLDNGQISLAINALRTLQFARSLAEPNLVTTNGQMATFHVGSEFPVPAASVTFGAVGQGVSFIPVGVSLFFTPSITDHDRVRLMVAAQVSSIDAALAASISGTTVPGVDSRTFRTTVELRDGQTLAIAGLVQNNLIGTSARVPLWGDLPLLGTMFGTRSTSSQEQELVVLVTPELVHPLEACKTPPIPGADIFEPGDVEFFLFNRLESLRGHDFRSATRTDWDRMRVYERCEDQLIIGAQGRTYGCCCRGQGGGNGGGPCACQVPGPMNGAVGQTPPNQCMPGQCMPYNGPAAPSGAPLDPIPSPTATSSRNNADIPVGKVR